MVFYLKIVKYHYLYTCMNLVNPMNLKREIYTCLAVILFTFLLPTGNYAQEVIGTTFQQNGSAGFFGTMISTTNPNTTIDGSPYYNENWKSGMLILENKQEIPVDQLNYNVFENSLTYKEKNREYLLSTSIEVDKFSIGNDAFVYIETGNHKEIYQLLSDGPLKLLKKYYCKILMGTESKGVIAATNDKYMVNDDYYFQFGQDQPEPFKTKKRDVFDLMEKQEDQVKDYMSKMNLNINKEPDLVQLFDYYNQLTSIQ